MTLEEQIGAICDLAAQIDVPPDLESKMVQALHDSGLFKYEDLENDTLLKRLKEQTP